MILAVAEQAMGRSVGTEMAIMFFLFLGMWFILIAPQRKRQKKHEQMIKELQKGDKVLTSSGIFGEITSVKSDRFDIKIAENTTIGVHKTAIASKI